MSLTGLKTLSDEAAGALWANPRIIMPETGRLSRIDRTARAGQERRAAIDLAKEEQSVRSFLSAHCADCHAGGQKEGEFELARLDRDDVAGRVAWASIFERLRAGDMPPSSEPRPKTEEASLVVQWIGAKLDSPLPGKPTYYTVKENPVDGNRLPNAILFGGPRGPGVPPPPRLWRLSPPAYSKWLASQFNAHGLQQPFGVIQEAGFRDFAALYAPDEGATGLLLSNAEQIVAAQTRSYPLINIVDKPEAAKDAHWPGEARIKLATEEERRRLAKGVRVKGSGVLAPLLHPDVRPTREELTKAIGQQYQTAFTRAPSEVELSSVLALYDEIAREGDLPVAGKTILMAPLMVPETILRFEVGLGLEVRPGVRMLSPRETALALSLALSQKRDPGLLSAAAEGKLATRDEVALSVQRNHVGRFRTTEEVVDKEKTNDPKNLDDSGKPKATKYATAPLDTTGVLDGTGDPKLDGPVKDPFDLIRRLAASERVEQVFVRHVFRFFMGRNETIEDGPVLVAAHQAYRDSGGSLKALLASLLTSDSFLCRTKE